MLFQGQQYWGLIIWKHKNSLFYSNVFLKAAYEMFSFSSEILFCNCFFF